MTRARRFRSAVAVAAVALTAAACTAAGAVKGRPSSSLLRPAQVHASPARPNIVFVLADDLSMDLVAHMPHVQDLSKQGTAMSHYYVVDSLCCPSRSAIFTGEYPHDDGVFTNHGRDGGLGAYTRHHDERKAFAVSLHAAGYRTGFMGKYLNEYEPHIAPAPGWDEWDVAGDGYPEFHYTLNENGKQRYYGRRPADYLTDVLAGKGGRFIDSAAAQHQPFMLEVATFAPHSPYTGPPRYARADTTLHYPRTPAYDALPTHPPSWLAKRVPLPAVRQRDIDAIYRKRLRAVHAIDDLLAHLQDRLRADGVARNTYVVFSSDNGYHMGEYRLMPGKQTAFDTDIHVPLIVSGPGVPRDATMPQLASNIDLAPTFEELTGTGIPHTVDGVSLAPLLHGTSPPDWQRAVLVEHHHAPSWEFGDPDRQPPASGVPPSYEAVRTAGALYVRYHTGEQEYYDTTSDPNELHNLGAHAVPTRMRATLAALTTCHSSTQCQAAARRP